MPENVFKSPRIATIVYAILIACSSVLSIGSRVVATAQTLPTVVGAQYWHTAGNRIVDVNGKRVRIAAVNWFGMEDEFFVPAGLEKQSLDSILTRVGDLGFNAIRLPFSNQLVEQNPIVTKHLDANPDLQGLHALDILDRIVAGAGRHGLRLILDNARSSAGTQPEASGLWYTNRYPEKAWIRDWLTLVQRYLGNPVVVGADIRNEPHTAPPGPWSIKSYLHQGATWGPYKGKVNTATDWRLAAQRAGNAILALNSHLLIIVEGVQLYPDGRSHNGIDSYWWGGILTPARWYPVRLRVRHQLVYSPHEYGPYKSPMPFFGVKMSYAGLQAVWEKHWGYLEKPTFSQEAPIFIGEFGVCGLPKCVRSKAAGSTGLWFRFFQRYLQAHREIGWAFWALNGTSHLGDPSPNYVLRDDWHTIRLQPLVDALRSIE
ncbi:MAG: hypothetical protein NVSMB52_14390 [Chloroflexota bacterium]